MAQISKPFADILAGGWTGDSGGSEVPLYAATDDPVASSDDDGSFALLLGSTSASFEVQMEALVNPGAVAGVFIRARTRYVSGGGLTPFTLALVEGTTIRATLPTYVLSTGYTDHEMELTPTQAGSITNWGNLRLRGTRGASSPASQVRVTSLEIEAPSVGEARASRAAVEVLAKGVPIKPAARATRAAVEVLGKGQPIRPETRATRAAVEVLARGNVIKPPIRATRAAVEVLARRLALPMHATRVAVEVLARARTMRASRAAVEVLAKSRVQSVTPLAFPAVQPSLFPHNWKSPLVLECSWSTDVVAAATSVAEERRALVDRPYREMDADLLGFSAGDALRLAMSMARGASARVVAPLYCDQSEASQDSSGSTLWCDTTYRRFFRGARVAACVPSFDGRFSSTQYLTISGVLPDRLGLSSPISGTLPKGTLVFPAFDAEVELQASSDLESDLVAGRRASFKEVVGRSALPASSLSPPPDLPSYRGDPVLDLSADWASDLEAGVSRAGERYGQGKGEVVFLRGERPQKTHQLGFLLYSRALFWRVLRLFDGLRARSRPLWIASPETLLDVRAVGPDYVDVQPAGNLADVQDFLPFVACALADGSYLFREVSSAALASGLWRVTFTEPLPFPAPLASDRWTSGLRARLQEDVMREEWLTTTVCRVTWKVLELLEEKSVDLPGIQDAPAYVSPLVLPGLRLLVDAQANLWTGSATGDRTSAAAPGLPGAQGDPVTRWDDARLAPSPGSPFLAGHSAGAYQAPRLTVLVPTWVNDGLPAALHDSGDPIGATGERFYLRPTDEQFFDNAQGLTLFWCGKVWPGSGRGWFLRRRGVLAWGLTGVQAYEDFDVVDATKWVSHPSLGDDMDPFACCLTWKPGSYLRVYKMGVLAGEAASQVSDLPTQSSIADELAAAETTVVCDLDSQPGRPSFTDCFVIYSRALSKDELNVVGWELARRYDLSRHWEKIL